MTVFWISWWDDPSGPPGKRLPVGALFESWVTGYRDFGDAEQQSICARVEATSADAAWALADVMYPGCRNYERFTEEQPAGWRPPADRFPAARPTTEEG